MACPSSSGLGSGAGSEADVSRLHEERKACAGLTEVLPELARREVRRVPGAFGTLIGLALDRREDFRLESLLNGLVTSALGDITGDAERSRGVVSGIVCGGDTVILLVRLPVLFSRLPLSVGEMGEV